MSKPGTAATPEKPIAKIAEVRRNAEAATRSRRPQAALRGPLPLGDLCDGFFFAVSAPVSVQRFARRHVLQQRGDLPVCDDRVRHFL